MNLYPTLSDLVVELRRNSNDDIAFAQRVALTCCLLVKNNPESIAAIEAVFGLV